MSPETTIKKVRKAPAATSVQHIVRASSRTQHRGTHTRTTSSLATRPISLQVPANRPDQRSASPQLKQPSSTSTVRRGGLSTASPCTFLCVCFSVYASTGHFGWRANRYSQAATHGTKPLAKCYLGGSRSHLSSKHFQYERAGFCYPTSFGIVRCRRNELIDGIRIATQTGTVTVRTIVDTSTSLLIEVSQFV
jgi:hypothetical protein